MTGGGREVRLGSGLVLELNNYLILISYVRTYKINKIERDNEKR